MAAQPGGGGASIGWCDRRRRVGVDVRRETRFRVIHVSCATKEKKHVS